MRNDCNLQQISQINRGRKHSKMKEKFPKTYQEEAKKETAKQTVRKKSGRRGREEF